VWVVACLALSFGIDIDTTREVDMAYNKHQLRELIVEVLQDHDLWSETAVELLMLTAAVESNLGTFIKQTRGPALGAFQMEPATHNDIWNNYLSYKREVLRGGFVRQSEKDLRTDLKYAILMARIHYLRVPERLPTSTSPKDLGKYWKKYYNTHLGKGTVEKAIEKYNKYCA
jgi:hypothetical protein